MTDTARLQTCSILWKAECLHAAGSKSKPKPTLRDHEKKASFLGTKMGLHGVFQPRKTLKTSGLENKMREVAYNTWEQVVSDRKYFILMSHTENMSCSV